MTMYITCYLVLAVTIDHARTPGRPACVRMYTVSIPGSLVLVRVRDGKRCICWHYFDGRASKIDATFWGPVRETKEE